MDTEPSHHHGCEPVRRHTLYPAWAISMPATTISTKQTTASTMNRTACLDGSYGSWQEPFLGLAANEGAFSV